jgi:hypothetical protein
MKSLKNPAKKHQNPLPDIILWNLYAACKLGCLHAKTSEKLSILCGIAVKLR